MSTECIIVMDESCRLEDARELVRIYRDLAKARGVIQIDAELQVDFTSDEGLWVGGKLTSDGRKDLAHNLRLVREPRAMPVGFDNPFHSDFFERAPDAWLVLGGGEPPVQVASRDAMTAEMTRRKGGFQITETTAQGTPP